MDTRSTSRPAPAWAALFTPSGPENHADYADRDADARRVRSELAAIGVRYPEHT
jgi:hypothetical protein